MRILTLCYEFPPIGGGGGRVALGLARELARQGHQVELVTMRYGNQAPDEEIDGIRIRRVPCLRRSPFSCSVAEALTYLVRAVPAARRLVRRARPDVVHAHFALPDGLVARRVCRGPGVPYVITAHGSDVPGYNPHRLRWMHRVLAPVWRDVARRSARIVCPSRHLRSLVAAAAPDATTELVPYGFEPGPEPGPERREKRILVVTRILRRKGVQHLLKAVADLRIDHEVHVVGDGPFLPELRRLAEGSATPVRFRGWIENPSEELEGLLRASSIFVLPSEAENFPVALLEAMAAGLAIVTTRGTGCEEVVGDAALLVDPGDVRGIREAILRLVGDEGLRGSLGAAARARLEREFGWEGVARRYLAIYEEAGRAAAASSERSRSAHGA